MRRELEGGRADHRGARERVTGNVSSLSQRTVLMSVVAQGEVRVLASWTAARGAPESRAVALERRLPAFFIHRHVGDLGARDLHELSRVRDSLRFDLHAHANARGAEAHE